MKQYSIDLKSPFYWGRAGWGVMYEVWRNVKDCKMLFLNRFYE